MKGADDERVCKKLQPTKYSHNTIEAIHETKQNKSAMRRRFPQVDPPSCILSMKGTKASHNISLKSNYCLEELKKHKAEFLTQSDKQRNRSKIPPHAVFPGTEPEVKRNENNCDVTFLRKLLAMNKKEELVLNRKLAKLVLEEEFGFGQEENSCTKNLFSNTSVSNFDSKRKKNPRDSNKNKLIKVNNPSERVTSKFNNYSKTPYLPQYDMNGRRIYYSGENYNESEDEDCVSKYTSESEEDISNASEQFNAGRSKTYINTTTVIQTKSDITCDSLSRGKLSSRRNSMTLINLPVLDKRENRVRRKYEESSEEESKYRKCLFTKVDAAERGADRERRESSPGDGVQNVVVHCCAVPQDNMSSESKKKVLKVWNFNDIPKMKPAKLVETSNIKLHKVEQTKESPELSNKDRESTSSADKKSTRATRNVFVKRKSRPKTVC